MVPLEVTVALAAGVTVAGESKQVEARGAPEQVKETAEAKPLWEVTVAVKVTDPPAVTTPDVGDKEIVKSGVPAAVPVPERATLCGLPESLLVTVSVANSAAVVAGLKVTLMVQFAPAAKVAVEAGQVFAETAKSGAFVPVMEVLLIVKAELVPFVRVTVCAVLVVLTVWLSKLSDPGARETLPAEEAGENSATKAFFAPFRVFWKALPEVTKGGE